MLVKRWGGIGNFGRWQVMESWKKDVDTKFGQFLATTTSHAKALDDVQGMFKSFMGKNKYTNNGSPSIT